MDPGLAVIVSPGGYWALHRVGWLRRSAEGGDEWEIVGARSFRGLSTVPVVERTNDIVAAKGPTGRIELHRASSKPEPIHRGHIRRVVYCDVEVWSEFCPKPADWAA